MMLNLKKATEFIRCIKCCNYGAYSKTVNLPKTKFPRYVKKVRQLQHYNDIREKSMKSLYMWQRENLSGKEFILHDGPPYANGDVHMGHAVNKILKDIIIRHCISNRNRVHYIPGWDCHGLPIELKAKISSKRDSAIQIRQSSREFAAKTIEAQRKEFQSWGVTAEWESNDSIYRTFHPRYIENQLNIFYQMYEKKMIFRDLKPVYYSPSSKTALAEAELEYDERHESPSLYFRTKLTKISSKILNASSAEVYAIIWTTTPWTLPSNQAISFNPELKYALIKLNGSNEYYIIAEELKSSLQTTLSEAATIETIICFDGNLLFECKYLHPLNSNNELPFLPAKHVLSDKGTGLVHTAPCHGFEDYLVAMENNIPLARLVDECGKFNENAPDFLQGKEVIEHGNDLVLQHIASDIIHSGTICHSYPIDWRTKKPVIINATWQWFINVEVLKDKAIAEVEKVNLFPSGKRKTQLIDSIRNRPYWCISRQRVWGTPIPVFYHNETGEVILNKEIVDHVNKMLIENGNIDFWWEKNIDELVPAQILNGLNLKATDLVKGQDILDIWFDSGISWSYALEEPKVADLYLEGYDQFTGWFQSSLLTSVAVRNKSPFKQIFAHGFTVDEKGNKMSKSIGNVIHPKDIITNHNVDAMRWWIALHVSDSSTIPIKQHLLTEAANDVQVCRSTLMFLLSYLEQCNIKAIKPGEFETERYSALDKFTMNALVKFHDKAEEYAKNYQFSSYVININNYVNNELSATYIHSIKDRLYCGSPEEQRIIIQIFHALFQVTCKVLWPIIPFLVEECWSYYNKQHPFYETEIRVLNEWRNNQFDDSVNLAKQILSSFGSDKSLNTQRFCIVITANNDNIDLLEKLHPNDGQIHNNSNLCELLRVQSIQLKRSISGELNIAKTEINGNLCVRCRKFSIENNELCSRCEKILRQ